MKRGGKGMYKFITTPPKIQRSFYGGFEVTFFVPECQGDNIQSMFESTCFSDSPKEWILTAKPRREKKSERANDYLWALCDDIAFKLGGPKASRDLKRKEIYIDAVKEVGKFQILKVPIDQVDYVIHTWEQQGLAWPCRILDKTRDGESVELMCCYGSSSYDTKEESRLIDYIISCAEELGIPTDPEERSRDQLKKTEEAIKMLHEMGQGREEITG